MTIRISKNGEWHAVAAEPFGSQYPLALRRKSGGAVTGWAFAQQFIDGILYDYGSGAKGVYMGGVLYPWLSLDRTRARYPGAMNIVSHFNYYREATLTTDGIFVAPSIGQSYWSANFSAVTLGNEVFNVTGPGFSITGDAGKIYYVPADNGSWLMVIGNYVTHGFDTGFLRLSETRYNTPMECPGFKYYLA